MIVVYIIAAISAVMWFICMTKFVILGSDTPKTTKSGIIISMLLLVLTVGVDLAIRII